MSTLPRSAVSALKQNFEANNNSSGSSASTRHHQQKRHETGVLADMNAQKKLARIQQAAQPSIGAILNTTASLVPAAVRPTVSKQPSWVGPVPAERPVTPGLTKMIFPVTIEFYLPGTQPPVYVATDLSKPQWRPVELDSTQDEEGEYKFSMTFEAEQGEYQYKLRLGPGDWWICDDSVSKVTDDAGNENNLLLVGPDAKTSASKKAKTGGSVDEASGSTDLGRQDSAHFEASMPQELLSHKKDSKAHPHLMHKHSQRDLHDSPALTTLVGHELRAQTSPVANHDDDDAADDDEPENPPLLRHESVAPSSREQEHSPLFRHESTAIDAQHHHDDTRHQSSPRSSSRKYSGDSIPEEADPNDSSLEQFPTDHRGIIEHLDRARRSMQEDETSDDPGSLSRRSPSSSGIANTSASLPSVREDDAEEDEETAARPEKADLDADVPQVVISEVHERSFAPMTPPMTPKEDQARESNDVSTEKSDHSLSSSVREKFEHIKKKTHHKVKEVAHSGLPALAIGLAVTMAAISAALAIWYIKIKNDNVVL